VGCRLWWDEDHLPYLELLCDGCGVSFTCFDDSCYDWRLLRDAALYGWDARHSLDGPHHCPACQRRATASRAPGAADDPVVLRRRGNQQHSGQGSR
jgi:hypothetical protein